jgi:hypothetical protein
MSFHSIISVLVATATSDETAVCYHRCQGNEHAKSS